MKSTVSSPAPPMGHRLTALVLLGLLAGPFMSMIDSSVVNVALAVIARGFKTDLATAQWVISGYLLALAFGLPASAFLAKRYGTRRIYLVSMAGFTLSSLACAFAPTLPVLIATRVLQGLCGAPLVPLAMNVLLGPNGSARKGIPPVAGGLLFLAPALGPTVGGLLLRVGAWPLIFLVNVPIGLLGLIGATRISKELAGRGDRAARFDPPGLALASFGLTLTIYGATAGAQKSWLGGDVWPFWGGGAILLFLYILYALIRPHPALDLKLLRHSQSALALFLVCMVSIVMAAMLLVTPIYLQQIQGTSTLVAGLVLLPQGLVTGLGAVLGMELAKWWGERTCICFGTVILVATTALLLLLDLATPAWLTALLLCGRGLATGLVLQPLLTVMLHGLTQHELPDGNTLFTVTDNLGGSGGVALLATLLQQRETTRILDTLRAHGMPASALHSIEGGVSGIQPILRHALGEAAIAGLHDTILALIMVAALGAIAAVFVRNPQRQTNTDAKAMTEQKAR